MPPKFPKIKKKDPFEFLPETEEADGAPLQPKPHLSPRFDLEDEESITAMLNHLDEEGYTIIAGVIPTTEEIEQGKTLFWDYAEQTSTKLKRHDITTWDQENWLDPHAASSGIIGYSEFVHSSFLWYSRLLPKIRKAFAAIWKDDDLLVSFDGGNAFRPWQINPSWTTRTAWWHTDQNSLRKDMNRKGRVSVQGLVTYYDIDADATGGFCCIPRSHIEHERLCERTPSARYNLIDYVRVEGNDPLLQSPYEAIIPLAKAGDMIIWDSRLIHSNTPGILAPKNDPEHPIPSPPREEWIRNVSQVSPEGRQDWLQRLVAYVCMVPRSFATPEALDNKKLAFLQGKGGNHWPQELIATVKAYQEEKKHEYRDITNCSEDMLQLAGFTRQEIDTRNFIPLLKYPS